MNTILVQPRMTAEELRELIEAADLSRAEVGAALGTHETNITHYLAERHNIPEDFAERARAFLLEKARERNTKIGTTLAKYY